MPSPSRYTGGQAAATAREPLTKGKVRLPIPSNTPTGTAPTAEAATDTPDRTTGQARLHPPTTEDPGRRHIPEARAVRQGAVLHSRVHKASRAGRHTPGLPTPTAGRRSHVPTARRAGKATAVLQAPASTGRQPQVRQEDPPAEDPFTEDGNPDSLY